MSKTPFENKIEAKLKELNLYKEEDIREKEREALAKLNPDEASKKQKELTKSRNLMFYQELKNKRVSKIKSRLYHKIKKKRELKTQEKLATMDGADPEVQLRELDELEQKRAEVMIYYDKTPLYVKCR
jgi:U3 small nucleolar RNA-associated protein 14